MQVKFRGKRLDGGGWVFGFLIGNLDPHKEHYEYRSWFIHDGVNISVPVEVEPSSIGMFTGLTDKNGKEIYGAVGENGGDIIRNLSDADYEVMYFKDVASFIAHDKGNFNELLFAVYSPFTEIIGNAFDNPELLEK